jgi:transposase
MRLHGNAALSWSGRRRLAERVVVEGWTLTAAAEAAGVSMRCARKWVGRYRLAGERGLFDRSSRPRRVANRTPEERVRLIVAMRRLRFTGPEIAELLGMAVSTVSGILSRQGLGRLGRLGLEQPLRYERSRPGELVHIDASESDYAGRERKGEHSGDGGSRGFLCRPSYGRRQSRRSGPSIPQGRKRRSPQPNGEHPRPRVAHRTGSASAAALPPLLTGSVRAGIGLLGQPARAPATTSGLRHEAPESGVAQGRAREDGLRSLQAQGVGRASVRARGLEQPGQGLKGHTAGFERGRLIEEKAAGGAELVSPAVGAGRAHPGGLRPCFVGCWTRDCCAGVAIPTLGSRRRSLPQKRRSIACT